MTDSLRPDPPAEQPIGGRHWEPRPEPLDRWRVVRGDERQHRCRMNGRWCVCEAPVVGGMNRSRTRGRSLWHFYCQEHLAGYGRWVEDDRVMFWRACSGSLRESSGE